MSPHWRPPQYTPPGKGGQGTCQPTPGLRACARRFHLRDLGGLALPGWWNGRHEGLRSLCRKVCRFESCPGHQNTLWNILGEHRLNLCGDEGRHPGMQKGGGRLDKEWIRRLGSCVERSIRGTVEDRKSVV